MKIVKELEMTKEKKNLIYSMLLNIKDNINELVENFNIDNPNWQEILNILDESESEIVYILNNAKNETKKEISNLEEKSTHEAEYDLYDKDSNERSRTVVIRYRTRK